MWFVAPRGGLSICRSVRNNGKEGAATPHARTPTATFHLKIEIS